MVVVPYVKVLSKIFERILKSHGIATANRPHRTADATELCAWFIRRTRSRMKRRPNLSCPLQELLQLICWRYRQEVRSEDQGIQERSGLFHSWYTDPSLQGKGEQCNSQVSHDRPCRGTEPLSSTGTRQKWSTERHSDRPQMDKRGTIIGVMQGN